MSDEGEPGAGCSGSEVGRLEAEPEGGMTGHSPGLAGLERGIQPPPYRGCISEPERQDYMPAGGAEDRLRIRSRLGALRPRFTGASYNSPQPSPVTEVEEDK